MDIIFCEKNGDLIRVMFPLGEDEFSDEEEIYNNTIDIKHHKFYVRDNKTLYGPIETFEEASSFSLKLIGFKKLFDIFRADINKK